MGSQNYPTLEINHPLFLDVSIIRSGLALAYSARLNFCEYCMVYCAKFLRLLLLLLLFACLFVCLFVCFYFRERFFAYILISSSLPIKYRYLLKGKQRTVV